MAEDTSTDQDKVKKTTGEVTAAGTGVVDPGVIDKGAKATEIAASGAISERAAVAAVPMKHPAVDDNPRAGVPAESNRIDFNDPSFSSTGVTEV